MHQSKGRSWSPLRSLSLVVIFLLACVLSNTAAAKEAIPLQVKSTTQFINMHTGPGRGYPAFHVIEKDEVITLIKSKNNWIKASTEKGIEGWIHRRDMDNTIGLNGELVKLGIPSREDYADRKWEVGFSFGQFDSIPSLGLHGGYRFTNNLTFELQLSQATGSSSKNEIMTLGLVHQPFPEWRFSPYFTLATGTITTSVKSTGVQIADASDEVFLMGVGGYYYLSNRFMVKVELNQFTSLPSEDFNTEINELKIGFSSFF